MSIENIYCNLSGGTTNGSPRTLTNVSNTLYRNLYMNVHIGLPRMRHGVLIQVLLASSFKYLMLKLRQMFLY